MKARWLMMMPAVAAMMLPAGASLAQDAEAGAKVFNKCRACHVADKEQNRVGPTLYGVFGRKSGSVEGFNYSDAMKNADITWSDETIGEYLADPKGYVPGNRMAFVGLKDQEDIQNVLAYLHEVTGS